MIYSPRWSNLPSPHHSDYSLDFVTIHVFGVAQTVKIDIISGDGVLIDSLQFPASKSGEINQPWKIPKDLEPGTYTIKVSDAFDTSETTFDIE